MAQRRDKMTDFKKTTTKELLEELNRRMSKEKIKAYLEKRKEVKAVFKEVINSMVKEKEEEPEFLFKFPDDPKDFDVKTMTEWHKMTELYYHFAQRWEAQERGGCCSVDRAYFRYLKPKCEELLNYLRR